MPGGDRTGPIGTGPMTGRRAGYCSGYDRPGFASPGMGLGMRFGGRFGGQGRWFGWRHRFYASGHPYWARAGYTPQAPDQELAFLKDEAERLRRELGAINQRIEELEQN